jgi:hypothetical protein
VQVGTEAEALEAYGRAIAIREALVQADPSAAEPRRALARILEKLGLLEVRVSGRQAEGLRTLGRALALREAIATGHPGDVKDRQVIAASHRAIAIGHANLGHEAEALSSVGISPNSAARAQR